MAVGRGRGAFWRFLRVKARRRIGERVVWFFFFRRLAVIFSGGRFFLEGGRKLERKGE